VLAIAGTFKSLADLSGPKELVIRARFTDTLFECWVALVIQTWATDYDGFTHVPTRSHKLIYESVELHIGDKVFVPHEGLQAMVIARDFDYDLDTLRLLMPLGHDLEVAARIPGMAEFRALRGLKTCRILVSEEEKNLNGASVQKMIERMTEDVYKPQG